MQFHGAEAHRRCPGSEHGVAAQVLEPAVGNGAESARRVNIAFSLLREMITARSLALDMRQDGTGTMIFDDVRRILPAVVQDNILVVLRKTPHHFRILASNSKN